MLFLNVDRFNRKKFSLQVDIKLFQKVFKEQEVHLCINTYKDIHSCTKAEGNEFTVENLCKTYMREYNGTRNFQIWLGDDYQLGTGEQLFYLCAPLCSKCVFFTYNSVWVPLQVQALNSAEDGCECSISLLHSLVQLITTPSPSCLVTDHLGEVADASTEAQRCEGQRVRRARGGRGRRSVNNVGGQRSQ